MTVDRDIHPSGTQAGRYAAESTRPPTIQWVGSVDGKVELIDQTLLPAELTVEACETVESIREAIRQLKVRGAPAIGIAAAMGMVIGIRDAASEDEFREKLRKVGDRLISARPTAVNLPWAVRRMQQVGSSAIASDGLEAAKERLLDEACRIRQEDADMCRAIGEAGWDLVPEGGAVITHCNAGGLATAEYGTALAILYAAREHGRDFEVFVDETRPLLQGARLTAWELSRAGIPVTVICDSASAQVMRGRHVGLAVTGADRIAANGDVANKIGTYGLALHAKAHGVPFYVAAPTSTFDRDTPGGDAIRIEERSEAEISRFGGSQTVPEGVSCYNPAFDVTPADLVSGIVYERGRIEPVTADGVREIFSDSSLH